MAQQATDTRKESYAVMAHRSPGRGHDGEISPGGVVGTLDEKSDEILIIIGFSVGNEMTDTRK